MSYSAILALDDKHRCECGEAVNEINQNVDLINHSQGSGKKISDLRILSISDEILARRQPGY
jgi:hypothetical protein